MLKRIQELFQNGKTNKEILDDLVAQFSSSANVEIIETGLYSIPNSNVRYDKTVDWPRNPVVYRCQESNCFWFRSEESIDYNIGNDKIEKCTVLVVNRTFIVHVKSNEADTQKQRIVLSSFD